ncbi:hypothetical protein F9C07_2282454 [Aspergillus flavus]|uniref:Uncharacterized protein n=1 Tax=Aspergillus flavus (strain ATCC 200026 / FGSC A1120 / IAM 13836 / NRRL 3357 / JCM 12722 / SRRC 167) TaxID=332952 RepID=A0A7U2MMQ9_ASPFN|nr:uncharacterized protein G4B84_005428 [Aspergillus flavus NRRL3357]KAF7620549.1 hypothetical protein AFLA_005854 [Aspergillus flavus NRRL3357]QMW30093.1 hypothetical protein G4B84_005428 [Aspergillus flavus NRRL3357]QRD86535.1 hypothetical protein F9C07_2282454 [Aspergillus flavus]
MDPLEPNPTQDPDKQPKPGKFRFKTSKSKSSSRRDDTASTHHHSSHRHTSHRHRSKRHHRRRSASPTPIHSDQQQPGLNADAAFRESLFDALGDDEGASYWETVYGQPIHNYAVPNVPKGPNGELEQMDEEEYASYVRTKMWERTREGMLAEQERLRAEKARQKRRDERREEDMREKMRFERAMEESLRRGKERRRVKAWGRVWEEYVRSWGEVDRAVEQVRDTGDCGRGGGEGTKLRNLIFWPVESGKRGDVSRETVEEFMRHAPGEDLLAVLKAERVRWHPDKIQHRYGALGIDEMVMRSVTEVFQIIDRLWSEMKGKQS